MVGEYGTFVITKWEGGGFSFELELELVEGLFQGCGVYVVHCTKY